MSDTKATYLYKTYDEKGYPLLWYSYKGFTYCIQYNTEESFAYQHRYEQDAIDTKLARAEKLKSFKGEPAEIGFQKFWDYIDGKSEE